MIELAKGVRDFGPEEKILREELISKLTEIFRAYGYSPLETPSIERLDTLTSKFGAGEESDAVKEIFKFRDQGDRDLGLRFDLTVPFSRFVAMNPTLKMPFKRYEIGRVFRDGPIKLGRYREFWQCDVDVVGVKGMQADAELMLLVLDAFKKLSLDAYIQVNNRKLLMGIMDYCAIPEFIRSSVIITIDKLEKQGQSSVEKELMTKISAEQTDKLMTVFGIKGSNQEIIDALKDILNSPMGKEGLFEIEELFNYIKFIEHGKIILNISLARGLNYYTGTVFEGFLKDSKVTSSIFGGGRYDNMIGMFADNNREYPAVGLSFGLEPITEALKLIGIEKKTVAELYIIPIKTFAESIIIATKLREAGLNVDIDLMDRGLSKNLDYANALNIPYVAFIGDQEIAAQKIKLKNMHSGEEKLMTLEEAYERIKS